VEDLAWIPDDAWVVVSVRVADLANKLALDRKGWLMKGLAAFEQASSQRLADVERCTIVFANVPDLVPGSPGWGPVLIVRTSRPYDRKALEATRDDSHLPHGNFHFVDERTYLFGPGQAVDRCKAGKMADKRGALAAVLSSADTHELTAWGRASPLPLASNDPEKPDPVGAFGLPFPLPPGLEWVAATLDMGSNTRLAVRFSCKDEETAEVAAKFLREGVGPVRVLLPELVKKGTAGSPKDAVEALVRLAEDAVGGARVRTDGRAATLDVRVASGARELGALVQSLEPSDPDASEASQPPAPPRAPSRDCGVEGTRKFTVANVRKEPALLFKEGKGGKLIFVRKVPVGEAVDLETPVNLYWFAVFVEKPGGESFTPDSSGAVWLLREPKDDKDAADRKKPSTTGKIEWRTDYQKARQEAREQGRPLLLLCGTSSCHWCDRLEEAIRKDADSSKLLQESLVPVKLSAADNLALFTALKIEKYPTILLASNEGKILRRLEGFHEAETLNKELREELQRAKAAPR
jgi:hypothetical protein